MPVLTALAIFPARREESLPSLKGNSTLSLVLVAIGSTFLFADAVVVPRTFRDHHEIS